MYQTLSKFVCYKTTAKKRWSLPKMVFMDVKTTFRHTFLSSDLHCLPPGDPRVLCANMGIRLLANHSLYMHIIYNNIHDDVHLYMHSSASRRVGRIWEAVMQTLDYVSCLVCITFENSPSPWVFRLSYVNAEKVLYCFYRIYVTTVFAYSHRNTAIDQWECT